MLATRNTILANFIALRLLSLFSAHRQAVDSDRRTSHRATEFEITSNFGDVEKHFFQVSGNGDFFHGISQFAAGNPHTRSPTGIVAGHEIGAVSEELSHVQAVFNLRDNFLGRFLPRLQKVIAWPDSGRAGQSARSVPGGPQAKLFRSIGIQQIRPEHTILNDDGASRGYPFTIKGAGTESTRDGAIVNHIDAIASDLLTQLSRQKRCTAINRIAVHALKNMFENRI